MKIGKIKRRCVVCGKKLEIILNKDNSYSGGHYFGKIKIPVGKGKYVKVGTSDILSKETDVDVVKWTGEEKKVEYWECNECYSK